MTKQELDLGGVIVATTLAFKEDPTAPAGLAVDYDRFAKHCDWLITNGCRGVGPNGSLGEYSSLTEQERRKVVQVAVEAVGGRG
ncbi:MAG: dihydrodipicolinate synthase family protein, partial [Dermatophilaceae bacterium]